MKNYVDKVSEKKCIDEYTLIAKQIFLKRKIKECIGNKKISPEKGEEETR